MRETETTPHPPFGHLLPQGEKAIIAVVIACLATPALAERAGWHYSSVAGEGDRAAMGCAITVVRDAYACVVVRCEDDFSTGLYVHTSGPGEDAGRWNLQIDDTNYPLVTEARPGVPYHAGVTGEVAEVIDAIKNGGTMILERPDGSNGHPIPLSGSLYAINQALYFCAPKAVPEN